MLELINMRCLRLMMAKLAAEEIVGAALPDFSYQTCEPCERGEISEPLKLLLPREFT